MFTLLKNQINKLDLFLIFSFVIGLIPASFLIHIAPVDFSGFYFQAVSFLEHREYSYQFIQNYCDNPINTGLNARAPLVPFLMAISMFFFDKTLLGIYLPFFLARIILTPLTYLTAKFFVDKRIAFLASLTTVFLPKLQTYSLSAMEGDVFVALFGLLALYCYLKSAKLKGKLFTLFTGVSLALCALTKSTGLGLSLGFLLAVFLENLIIFKRKFRIQNFLLLVTGFVLLFGPYILWTYFVHHQFYITTQHDKSFFYVVNNLPALLMTIPLYFGMNFTAGPKAFLISSVMLFILCVGIIKVIKNKQYVLLLPTFITLILISTLESCVIGGAISFSTEFATILGFMMFYLVIVFFIGSESLITSVNEKLHLPFPKFLKLIIYLLLMYKIVNNYFTVKLAIDFVPNEYYISLPTVIKNRQKLPEVTFVKENGLLMFKGPVVHRIMRQQFENFRFKPYAKFYTSLLFSVSIIGLITFVIFSLF